MSQMYVQTDGKDTAQPLFYDYALENPRESRIQGRPVFDQVVMVDIIVPGSRDIISRPIQEADKDRWPQQWAQFQNKQKQTPNGTPIDELTTATAVQRATCKALNVLTIEGLAHFPETNMNKLGQNAHGLKRLAVAFLESRKGASYATALQAEVESLKEQVASLKAQMAGKDGEQPKESRH